jgi:hypothetical protein
MLAVAEELSWGPSIQARDCALCNGAGGMRKAARDRVCHLFNAAQMRRFTEIDPIRQVSGGLHALFERPGAAVQGCRDGFQTGGEAGRSRGLDSGEHARSDFEFFR